MKLFSKDKTTHTEKIQKLLRLEDAVDAIFAMGHQTMKGNLFESVALSIHKLTGAHSVIVGKLNEDSDSITTVAFLNNGKICDNYTYQLSNTPCQHVFANHICSYPSGAAQKFPDDKGLTDNNIEAYIGVPFYYNDNSPKGLIVALFADPVENFKVIESLLKIYGVRVALELEHLTNRALLEEQNNNLNILFSQLTKKNAELDNYIAEVENARALAEESNQLKTAFLANLSHEVRTPMNVMLGFAELLKSEGISHEERVDFIDIINQNGMQLLKIMDNLIDISKFQSRKSLDQPRALGLNDLLDRFYIQYNDYLRMVQKPVKLQLVKGLPDGDDVVMADYEGVTKVLNQLLDNAIKFTADGEIKCGYRLDGSSVCFFVSDTGIGVPEGMDDKIFELFRQVDLRQSRDFGGNGLGLAIARKFTELMGGSIWLDRSVDKGACFCFKIPLVRTSSDHHLHSSFN